jgi:hypothetical protein
MAGATEEKIVELTAERDAAQAALDAGEDVVPVELVAMPSEAWEALTAEYMLPSGDDFAWRDLLPHALAACCADESLRDAEFWTERLASPALASGEVAALRRGVLFVNSHAPGVYVPKD